MKGATMENEYAYIKDGKVFLKGYLDMPDRQIGEVKRTEEEAFQYFVNRYSIAETKVEQLEKDIEEAQNKGSYLTKLVQLRKRILNFDGIGNFIPLLEKLDKMEVVLEELIEKNQANNLTIKEQLIEEANAIAGSEEWRETADQLQEIRTRWIRTGPVEKEKNDEIENTFREVLDGFYQRRKEFFDEQNRIIDERMAQYDALIRDAERLVRRYDWDEAFIELKRIQTEWKTIGNVPPKKLKFPFQRFKRLTGNFYNAYCKAKGIQIKPRIDPRIQAQMNMVNEAESLAASDDIFTATNRAKILLNEWKGVKVPLQLADRNLAERFRGACDKIFELSYLMKVVHRKHPTYNFLSESQQLVIKYREMEYIVRRARADLEQLVDSYKGVYQKPNTEMDKIMENNLRTQKRKLLMKEVILEELRQRSAKYL